ncbi:unnamed protein product [Microthlaspi erraticum]|uniref:RING-type E3 ubiquitin transferase n=1 Tax=Microthlaspi erraticum TaxID=1685480 RepID=A0A6D2J1D3_9BRAS|nr:unnamed protein product [Microthlaspi erraticum]
MHILIYTPSPAPSLYTLVTFLLAVISCALLLALFAACFRSIYLTVLNFFDDGESPPPPNNSLKKKLLQSHPESTFTASADSPCYSTECAVCLTKFSEGEEIWVLPMCSHAFHVACIGKWLTYSSSCPSCRRIMVPVNDV